MLSEGTVCNSTQLALSEYRLSQATFDNCFGSEWYEIAEELELALGVIPMRLQPRKLMLVPAYNP